MSQAQHKERRCFQGLCCCSIDAAGYQSTVCPSTLSSHTMHVAAAAATAAGLPREVDHEVHCQVGRLSTAGHSFRCVLCMQLHRGVSNTTNRGRTDCQNMHWHIMQHVVHAVWSCQHTGAGDMSPVCPGSTDEARAEHTTHPSTHTSVPTFTLKKYMLASPSCLCWCCQ